MRKTITQAASQALALSLGVLCGICAFASPALADSHDSHDSGADLSAGAFAQYGFARQSGRLLDGYVIPEALREEAGGNFQPCGRYATPLTVNLDRLVTDAYGGCFDAPANYYTGDLRSFAARSEGAAVTGLDGARLTVQELAYSEDGHVLGLLALPRSGDEAQGFYLPADQVEVTASKSGRFQFDISGNSEAAQALQDWLPPSGVITSPDVPRALNPEISIAVPLSQ